MPNEFEMQEHWKPLVEAAGLWDAKQSPATTYLVAGEIIHDAFLVRKHTRKLSAWTPPGKTEYEWADSGQMWIEVLKELSPGERAELRMRIAAKHPNVVWA